MRQAEFSELLGKTLAKVIRTDDSVRFVVDDGSVYLQHHVDYCCESVLVESIVGDLEHLIGSPITMADESSNSDNPPESEYGTPESFTWTFYKLATIKGYVDIRWFGRSNGYYSERVDFVLETEPRGCGRE